MFTGIITDLGVIHERTPVASGLRLGIACSYPPVSFSKGDSIACNGVCLTVTDFSQKDEGRTVFWADLSLETCRLTTFGQGQPNEKVNLEKSLKVGDELGGHMVYGHVDGIGIIKGISGKGVSHEFTIEAPQQLLPYIATKGSICVDGVSLTVNIVKADYFSVMIIPQTWNKTRFQFYEVGSKVNLEIDPLARYVARLLSSQAGNEHLQGVLRA